MKSPSPTLLPLLRSRSQGDILASILLEPERERSLSELAAETHVSPATVLREVDRLEQGGLVTTYRRGNARLVRAVTDSVLYRPLVELLAVTFGPIPLLRGALSGVTGVERAFIYGSWAARYAQQPGHVPGDIDLLVVGKVDAVELDRALAQVEKALRREVNVRKVSVDAWAADQGSFKATILSRPTVDLVGGADDA